MARTNDDNDPEIIEIVEEVLNNQMALAFLVGGAIIGAIILYAYLEYAKNVAGTVRVKLPTAPVFEQQEQAQEVEQ